MVVFLVADHNAIDMAEDSARQYLGWKQVVDGEKQLNLTHQQLDQANDRKEEFDRTLNDRIRNAYRWSVYPQQDDPSSAYTLASSRVPDSSGSMAERTGRFLAHNEMLVENYSGANFGEDVLKNIHSAFHDDMLTARELWGFITRFPYMPRMTDREVFDHAIEDVPNHAMESSTRFALASGYDAETGWFRNLIIPGVTDSSMTIQATDSTLLVQWDVAVAAYERMNREEKERERSTVEHEMANITEPASSSSASWKPFAGNDVASQPAEQQVSAPAIKKRYYASVDLDPETLNRQLAQLNELIIDQLRMARAHISISLDIQAETADGFDDGIMNVIINNAQNFKGIRNSEFEEE